jgi:hypothetical protein
MACRTYVNDACCGSEQVAAWSLSPDSVDQARAWLMRRTHRCLLQIIDLKGLHRGVQVWCASEWILERLLPYKDEPAYMDFDHPERGRNVRIVRGCAGGSLCWSEPRLSPNRSRITYAHWNKELRDLERYPVMSTRSSIVQAMVQGERQAH